MTSLGKKFLVGTIWMSASQVATYLLSFLADIALTRLLVPNDFGVFGLGISILSIIYILSQWGVAITVVQSEEIDQTLFDTGYILSWGLGLILLNLTLLVSFFLRSFYSVQVIGVLVILSGLKVFTILSNYYGATLKRGLDFRQVSFVQIGSRVASMGVAVFLAWLGCGVWSLVGKQAVVLIGGFLGMRTLSPWRYQSQFDISIARRFFAFGSQVFLSNGLETFLYKFPNLIIGSMLGTTAVGYFDRAIMLSHMGQTLAGPAVNDVSLSFYSRLQHSTERLKQAVRSINNFLTRIFMLVAILFFLIGKNTTVWLYGEKWHETGTLVPFLSVYLISMVVFGNLKHFLFSQNHAGVVARIRAVQCALFVVSAPFIIRRFELSGAALVISLLHLLGVGGAFLYVRHYVYIDLKSILLPPILVGVIVVGLYRLLLPYTMDQIESIILLLLNGAGIAVIYLAGLWLLEGKNLQHDIHYVLKLMGLRT